MKPPDDRRRRMVRSWIDSGLIVVCVALLFYFVPNTRVRFRDVWPGAIVTGLLWQGAFSLFSWYAADLARWSVHGSIASVVVFLLWVYVCAAILIYGVEVSAGLISEVEGCGGSG